MAVQELVRRLLPQASEFPIAPRPWNVFAHQCRAVGHSGTNTTARSGGNGFSIPLTLYSIGQSFSLCAWSQWLHLWKRCKGSSSPKSCFISSQGGARNKGQHPALLSKAFPPAVVQSHGCTQDWELVNVKCTGSEKCQSAWYVTYI